METSTLKELLSKPQRLRNLNADKLLVTAKAARKLSRESKDWASALDYWGLEQIARGLKLYIEAFADLKGSRFYSSWCKFEEAIICISSVRRNAEQLYCSYGLAQLEQTVKRWQGLYPYKIFTSPEFLIHEKLCSICGSQVKPRAHCGHLPGRVYEGELCVHVVKKADLLGLALVSNPVQKYSVVFLNDEVTGAKKDQYDYSLVKYVAGGLRSPFDAWDVHEEVRYRPHSDFPKAGRNSPCQCDSGVKFKKCCLNKPGVAYKHYRVKFENPPEGYTPYLETWSKARESVQGVL